jgi:hypothetical protein
LFKNYPILLIAPLGRILKKYAFTTCIVSGTHLVYIILSHFEVIVTIRQSYAKKHAKNEQLEVATPITVARIHIVISWRDLLFVAAL